MKKLIVLALIATSFTAGKHTATPQPIDNVYCMKGYVESLNMASDIVTVCTTCNNYLWKFEGIEDWEVFDRCELILQDVNETPFDCTDDIVIGCTYRN